MNLLDPIRLYALLLTREELEEIAEKLEGTEPAKKAKELLETIDGKRK